MPVISLPTTAMGPFGMPMVPGNGSSGGGGDPTFGSKTIAQTGTTWVYDGPDANSTVDVFTGITWVDNGNKFIASVSASGVNNSYGIYQFDTTTPYSTQPADISFNSSFLTYNEIADADYSPQSITFNSDGSKGYFGEDNEIFGFSMSTNYDISTATGTGHTKTGIPSHSTAPYSYGTVNDLRFNSDGTKMFVSEVSGNDCAILEFSLSSAYDVTTRSSSPTATFDPTTAGNGDTTLNTIIFNSDGTKMYALGPGSLGGVKLLFEYDLSTGFDLTTMSYNNENLNLETLAGIDLATSIAFDDDYYIMTIADGNDGVMQFHWGTAPPSGASPDMSTASYSTNFDTANETTAPMGLEFNGDGSKMFVIDESTRKIYRYSTPTAYSIASASYDSVNYDFSGTTTALNGFAFNSDGTSFYIVGNDQGGSTPDAIFQFDMSTGYDIANASYSKQGTTSDSGSAVDTSPEKIIFNNDGSKVYISGRSTNKVHQFSLSTPYDISTISYDSVALSIGTETSYRTGMQWGHDGKTLYILDGEGASPLSLDLYKFTTAFDVTTGSYDSTIDVSGNGLTRPTGLVVHPDGTNFIILDGHKTFATAKAFEFTTSAVGGGGGGGSPQGWISTISDELQGYGYTDVQLRSLAVDSSDNIIAAGDTAGNYQLVVKIKSDGTVDSAASFGASGQTNKHRAVAVDSSDGIFVAGEGPSMWSSSDAHTMRLNSNLTKSYDDFFGEGYSDEHWDITTDSSGNAFAVGESTSFALNFSGDPKGHLVKYDSTGGVAKTLISRSSQRSYPRGISSDGTNVYVIADDSSSLWIAKVNNALSSKTWSYHWGSASARDDILDIDTNSSGESVAYMWESGVIRIIKLASDGTADWRKYWYKNSTDYGDEYAGYNYNSGYGIKLLANGSVALRAGSYLGTGTSYRKSFYVVVFDSTGTEIVQKEFRLTPSGYYLGIPTKALVELSDGKIVTVQPYYTGSAWKNAVFKFDPMDTTTAINGTHGDWEISDITDGGTGTDSVSYGSGSVTLDSNMSMYFKSGYNQPSTPNGFPVSSATVVEDTQLTLGGGGGGGPSGGTYGTLTKTVDWDTIKGTVESTVDSWGFYPAGYAFNNDGTRMYVCARSWQTGTANDYNYTQVSIAQYNLSTAYDVATATYDKINNTVVAGLMSINDVAWNADGTKAFIAVAYENTYSPLANRYQTWECACSSAYDVSGINVSSPTNVMIMPFSDAQSLLFSHDGKKIFGANDTEGIFTVDLTTAYSFTGHTTGHTTANSCITSAQMGLGSNLRLWGISFSNDGKIAFITQGQAGANNQQWKLTLATAYDLTSYSNTETLTIGDVYVYDKSLITYNNVTNNVTFGSFSSARRWKYNETGSLDTSGGGSSPSYFGDKALFAGSSNKNPGQIDTLDITTPANATNFGSLGRYAYAMAAMSNGTRAVFAGGDNNITAIEYVTFATYSAPVTFGSTLATSNSGSWGSASDGTYGVYPANMNFNGNSLEYITIATTSNGTDFGDMYIAGDRRGGASDGTYGLISGGRSGGSNSTVTQTDRITIATPGNATDFGDNTLARMNLAGMGDGTYAVFAGGLKITQPYAWYNTMEYFTVATPGNATDFGDLVTGRSDTGATNNATRGVIAGGTGNSWQESNVIDYITIATPSNATSFGNLPTTKAYPSGTSGT